MNSKDLTAHLKVLLVIFLSLGLSTQALAEQKQKRRGNGRLAKVLKEMKLSPEQLEKIKAHRKENRGKMKPIREEARTLRQEMSKAFLNGASDGEIKSLNSRLQENRSRASEFRLSKMIFFKNLLTAEQRKIWNEKKKKWHKNKRKKWKRN